jgi:hypothetical protein
MVNFSASTYVLHRFLKNAILFLRLRMLAVVSVSDFSFEDRS